MLKVRPHTKCGCVGGGGGASGPIYEKWGGGGGGGGASGPIYEKQWRIQGGGGGQTRPMPPLTNKDTPPVHCNEFNYMSSATHCRSSCRPRPVVRVEYHP